MGGKKLKSKMLKLTLGFRKGLALLLSTNINIISIATERLEMNLSPVGDPVGVGKTMCLLGEETSVDRTCVSE